MFRKKSIIISLLILLTIIISVACSSENSGNNDGDSSSTNKEVVYATISEPIGLSPIGTWDGVSNKVITQIYERLFMYNPESGKIEPHLAESYENPDDTTWVIQLKQDITFHDGTPFNAEAVKYTFEEFIDPERASPAAQTYSDINYIETDGDYTVIIHTKEPTPTFINTLAAANSSIVSPTADQKQDIMVQPVGTGPFKFVEWIKGSDIVLESNENYWQGAPEISKLTVKIIPEMSTAISMLQSGDVQLVDGLNAQRLQRVEGIKDVDVIKQQGTYSYFFSVNHEKAPMNDLKFRQALAHALDLDSYREQLGGTGYHSAGIYGPSVVGYDPFIEELGYEYDPEKAKQIIQENGYDQQEFLFLTTTNGEYARMTEIIQAQLTEAGIKSRIETLDWGAFLSATAEGKFDLYILGSTNAYAAIDNLYSNHHSDNIGGSNRMRYNNAQLDNYINTAKSEFDELKRQELTNSAHRQIIEDVVVVPLHHGYVLVAHDNKISGIIVNPDGSWSLHKAKVE